MARLPTLVILAGIVMLFLPEPITSVLAVLVILAGIVLYILDDS